MRVAFFNTDCTESARNNTFFGICDDQNGTKAYTDSQNEDNWLAKVKNQGQIEIIFTAIDNCITILKEGTNDQESSCDGMLTFQNSLFLVELKRQGAGGWLTTATKQLKNTIKFLSESHDLSEFRYKKAYACNRKHPHFTKIEHETRKRFFEETNGFRIDAQAEIVIK
ncbi:MAG: hypothetical protein U9N63_09025 [Pseudomonadota bacterium]|nr:hypothetical protein [Pseudomonadota bacterium]